MFGGSHLCTCCTMANWLQECRQPGLIQAESTHSIGWSVAELRTVATLITRALQLRCLRQLLAFDQACMGMRHGVVVPTHVGPKVITSLQAF